MFPGGQKKFTQIPEVEDGLQGTESDEKQLVSKSYVDSLHDGKVAIFQDQKSPGTLGGSSVSGNNLRTLNTEVINSLSSVVFKLHRLDISGGYSQLPVEGEVLTGGTSGATGTAHFVSGSSAVYLRSVTGSFSTSESVTGSLGAGFSVSLAAGFTNYVGILNNSAAADNYFLSAGSINYRGAGSQLTINVQDGLGETNYRGLTEYLSPSASNATARNTVSASIAVSAGDRAVISLIQIVNSAVASNGLGHAASIGVPEIYSELIIRKS